MANTPNYGWEIPDVGGDVDTWGAILNNAMNSVDAQMFANNGTALQKVGGTMTGDIVLDAAEASTTVEVAGYKGMPQVVFSADYTPTLADAGKHALHSSGSAHIYNLPANSSVAFPIGTVLTIYNPPAQGNVTITRAGGVTLYFSTSNANRTVTAGGVATMVKYGSDLWFITGSGLS